MAMHDLLYYLADTSPSATSSWVAPGSIGAIMLGLIGYLLKVTIPDLMKRAQEASAQHVENLRKESEESRKLYREELQEMRKQNSTDRERFAAAMDRLSSSISHLEQRMAAMDGRVNRTEHANGG